MQSIQIRNLKKNKIQKHFDHRILFFQPKYKSEIVYSDEISTAQAVELVYDSSSSTVKMLENCADILRREILEKKTENSDSTWPPSSDYLHSCPVPEDLTIFLQRMFFPKIRDNISPMNDRKIKSIAQDICYIVCKGAWLLPKHLLLGMSVHHLTGSAQLVPLLNKFGHCISYSSVLQLETSIAEK